MNVGRLLLLSLVGQWCALLITIAATATETPVEEEKQYWEPTLLVDVAHPAVVASSSPLLTRDENATTRCVVSLNTPTPRAPLAALVPREHYDTELQKHREPGADDG